MLNFCFSIKETFSGSIVPSQNLSLFKPIYSSNIKNCVKSVRIRSISGQYSPTFGLNTERYGVRECGKIRARKTPNTDTFYEVKIFTKIYKVSCKNMSFIVIQINFIFDQAVPSNAII